METLVPRFPVITAVVRADRTGELTLNGTSRPVNALTLEQLRAGIIARCARIARDIRRPVRLLVDDTDDRYELAIHPDAYVQELSAAGTVADLADGAERTIAESPCRACGRSQSLRTSFCTRCGVEGPHEVETALVAKRE
jgi:hypothetical protein